MAETEFGKYILTGKPEIGVPEDAAGVKTAVLGGSADWNGITPRIVWKYVSQPVQMTLEAHKHDFEEYLVLLSNDPNNPEDLGAEIEISLGEEGEKHVITRASVVLLPKGVVHGPVTFTKVSKPVVFAVFCLSPEYTKTAVEVSGSTPARGKGKYGKYILTEPKGDPRPLATEKWGVHISDKTTGEVPVSTNFNFLSILGPHVLPDPPHDHDCDELLYLIPASADDWPNLGGEMELAFGKDWERNSITTAAVIALPKGILHCPVYIKEVKKPFYWGHMLPVASYESSAFDPDEV